MSLTQFADYDFRGAREFVLRAGDDDAPKVLIIPPLLEEMNRTRRMIVQMMRALAVHGIASILPDLPGTNESPFPLEQADFSVWREALKACGDQLGPIAGVVALRGGCLLSDSWAELPHWHFAPVDGARILRKMERAKLAGDEKAPENGSNIIHFAGYPLNSQMRENLQSTRVHANDKTRTVRLESDVPEADAKLPGTALWLRAEPGEDDPLSAALAADIAGWLA